MVLVMNKFSPGQMVYVVGKPGVEFGKPVTVLKVVPGVGVAVGVDKLTLLVEANYLTSKVLDIAA